MCVASLTLFQVINFIIETLPGRSQDHYEPLLSAFGICYREFSSEHLQGNYAKIYRAIEKKRDDRFPLWNVPLLKKNITVALMQDISGNNKMCYLHSATRNQQGRDRVVAFEWRDVEIFGGRFCPFEADVKALFVSHKKHVVFTDQNNRVFFQNIADSTGAELILEKVIVFNSINGSLSVVYINDSGSHVAAVWNEDEAHFVDWFSSPERAIDYIEQQDNVVRVYIVRPRFIVELSKPSKIKCHGEERDRDKPWDGGFDSLGRSTSAVHRGFTIFYLEKRLHSFRTLGNDNGQDYFSGDHGPIRLAFDVCI